MKKLLSFLLVLLIFTTTICVFIYSKNINEIVLFSFELWKKNIFPSLFPFLIISNILINIGFVEFLGNIFKKIMNKIFRISGSGSFVFFMSMLSGFPSSAKYIKDLLDKNLIDEKESQQLLSFCFFSNPLFIINTIGLMFFKTKSIGLIILISHILGNIILGIIIRKKDFVSEKKISFRKSISQFNNAINKSDIFNILINAISNSVQILIFIFGIITLFLIIISLVNNIFNLSNLNNAILSGILEMTSGLKYTSFLDIDVIYKIIISTALISFGGLSVHTQIMSILKDIKIRYLPFLISRIIHAFISSIIATILYNFIY